ncbi:MAG: hypothetical protein A2Y17_06565 [Clostridiales bacterium GWF2_38_85]|nr:MAG: hypothetical protein A2Y17_06565 [Clostridiales bacterium GWF2_38_85]HBL84877.1 hypothetical protein [Clostridiales bacterium]
MIKKRKTKLIAILLFCCIALTSCASNKDTVSTDGTSAVSEIVQHESNESTASAADSIETTYLYSDTVSGIMLTEVIAAESELIIPDSIDGKPVIAFADSLFESDTYLTKITLPAGLVSISTRAFAGCSALEEVIFNDTITAIESEAFTGCYLITEVTLPDSVTDISDDAFDFNIGSEPDVSEPPDVSEVSDVSEDPKGSENVDDVSQDESEEPIVISNDDFILMYQSNSKYSSHPYGDYTVGSHGCGPSCMAMIVTNLTDYNVNPAEMADWSYERGYMVGSVGTSFALMTEAAKNWGISCEEEYIYDAAIIIKALRQGKLVLVDMGPGIFTKGGHFIILRGITEDGKILIADSQRPTFSSQLWELNTLMNEIQTSKPIWVFTR